MDKSTFSVGFLESWIEKVGKQFELVVDQPLEHLKTIEKTLAVYRRLQEAAAERQGEDNGRIQ
ncbi:MAG: hypothetical protein WCC18_14660 [Candidatus Acidiferrales bacterium]